MPLKFWEKVWWCKVWGFTQGGQFWFTMLMPRCPRDDATSSGKWFAVYFYHFKHYSFLAGLQKILQRVYYSEIIDFKFNTLLSILVDMNWTILISVVIHTWRAFTFLLCQKVNAGKGFPPSPEATVDKEKWWWGSAVAAGYGGTNWSGRKEPFQ